MRYLCVISYDGTNYAGYQVQPNKVTIQSTIEQALKMIHKGKSVLITASGRTDARVHAVGQTFHFDTTLTIPIENWKRALNALLPDDILVKEVKQVADDFHARYDVTAKTYRYLVFNQREHDPFQRNYSYHVRGKLDIEAMQNACEYLIGEHDFSAFCAAKAGVKGSKVREIYYASCEKEKGRIVFTFTGNGFLYNMVRIIVGTILEIGTGRYPAEKLKRIIDSKQRAEAGKTVPPQGLYLSKVHYQSDFH